MLHNHCTLGVQSNYFYTPMAKTHTESCLKAKTLIHYAKFSTDLTLELQ